MGLDNRWAIRDVAKATFYSLVDGKVLTYLDTLKSSGVTVKSTTVYARGGSGNAKIIGFSSDKESKITLQDALFDNKVIGLLSGNTVTEGSKTIYKRDVIVVASHTANLTATPVGDPIGVFVLNADGSNGDEFTKETSVTATKQYSITAKAIETYTDVVDGTKLVVYYKVASGATAKTIKVTSDAFGGSFKLVLDILVTSASDKQIYPAQLIIFNCKMEDDWKLEFKPDGDPAVLDIPIEILKNGDSVDMWQMVIFDNDDLT